MGGLIKGTFQDMHDYLPNSIRPLRIDKYTHTLQVIDYAHHEIHAGSSFKVSYSVASIGAQTTPTDVISLDWTTPNTSKWMHAVFEAVCGGAGRVVLMEAPSGGAADPTGQIVPVNVNRNSIKTSGIAEFNYDSTVGTGGVVLIDEYIGSGVKSGGGVRDQNEIILKQGTKYSFWIFATGTVSASIHMHWYEHTDKS
jgi:hypothetical protein